jgi:hypothetical protein
MVTTGGFELSAAAAPAVVPVKETIAEVVRTVPAPQPAYTYQAPPAVVAPVVLPSAPAVPVVPAAQTLPGRPDIQYSFRPQDDLEDDNLPRPAPTLAQLAGAI